MAGGEEKLAGRFFALDAGAVLSVTDMVVTIKTLTKDSYMKLSFKHLLIPSLAVAALTGFGCACHTCCKPAAPADNATAPAVVAPAVVATAPVAAPVAVVPAGKVALKFVKVDSQETDGEDGKGENAVDGNPETFWHTQWQDASPACPHEIVIELVPPSTIKGFTYLPRQDEGINGTIKGYEFYVSNDGQDFGQPVAKGEWENNKDKKTVAFDAKACRFIKLKAISEINGEAWTSAAEIGVVTE